MPRRWIRSIGQARDLLPQPERLVVVEVDGGPYALGVEAVTAVVDRAGQQRPRELDGLALEIVAEGEVAGHLEERVVPGGDADILDVEGAHALLDARRAGVRRRLLPQEIGDELHHAGVDEQQVGVVENQRRARHGRVPGLDEVVGKASVDLVGLHRSSVPAAIVRRDTHDGPYRIVIALTRHPCGVRVAVTSASISIESSTDWSGARTVCITITVRSIRSGVSGVCSATTT